MNRKLTTGSALALTATLAMAPAAMAQAEVSGDFDLLWNACWEGPTEAVPDWIGTIDLGDDTYDMLFFNVGTGHPPGHAVEEPLGSFLEVWAVYDWLELVHGADCALEKLEGDLVMWGHDYGTGNTDTATYAMTGTVVEGFGDYADLAGHEVEMSGTFFHDKELGLDRAPGEFSVS